MKPITVEKQANGTWTVYNIPIVETGIEYMLQTGPHTFTDQELVEAAAAYYDTAIRAPRHKLGHSSGYNNVLVGDAEPAFGTFENLRVDDRGQALVADLEGCPEWLASILPMAFPSRSVEANADVETVTGHHYAMVIQAVSALGVYWPGCTVIEDLPKWYGSEVPDGVVFDPQLADSIAAKGGGMPRRKKDGQVDAAVDTSQIRRKFYSESDWSWWIRAEKFGDKEGMYLIIDDESSGDLLKIGVNVDGAEITFDEPVKVIEEHVPVAASMKQPEVRAAVVAGLASGDNDLVIHASRDETAPESIQGGGMDEATRKALATRLGLDPETATEQDVNNALDQRLPGPTAPPPVIQPQGEQTPGSQTGPQSGETPAPNVAPVGTGPATPMPDDPPPTGGVGTGDNAPPPGESVDAGAVIQLDRATFDRLVAGADAGLRLATNETNTRINNEVNAAKADGRIPPKAEKYWRDRLAEDFAAAKATLDALPKGMVPVNLRGSAGNGTEDGAAAGSGGLGLPDEWFPETVAARQRLASGGFAASGVITNAKEG